LLRRQWEVDVERRPAREAGFRAPKLVMIQSPDRRFKGRTLKLIGKLEAEHPSRTIAVLIPEVVKRHWWQHLLHTHRARRLANALSLYGGSRLLEEPKIEEAVDPGEALLPETPQPAADKPGGGRSSSFKDEQPTTGGANSDADHATDHIRTGSPSCVRSGPMTIPESFRDSTMPLTAYRSKKSFYGNARTYTHSVARWQIRR
jgi:hypothetical protein